MFAVVFFVRYYFYIEYSIDNVIGLDKAPDGRFLGVVSILSIWFIATANLITIFKPFFDVPALKTINKYFTPLAYLLGAICLPININMLMGPTFSQSIKFTSVMLAVEMGLGLALSINEWIKNPRIKKQGKNKYVRRLRCTGSGNDRIKCKNR